MKIFCDDCPTHGACEFAGCRRPLSQRAALKVREIVRDELRREAAIQRETRFVAPTPNVFEPL